MRIRRAEGQVLDKLLPHFPGHEGQSLHMTIYNGGMKWQKLIFFLGSLTWTENFEQTFHFDHLKWPNYMQQCCSKQTVDLMTLCA